MLKRFFLNFIGNGIGEKFRFSLNKQLMFLLSIIAIFVPYVLTIIILWYCKKNDIKLSTDNLINWGIAILTYYGGLATGLGGLYTYKRIRENAVSENNVE